MKFDGWSDVGGTHHARRLRCFGAEFVSREGTIMSAPQVTPATRPSDWTQLLGSVAALLVVIAATVLTLILA